jgi:hypothetical protein
MDLIARVASWRTLRSGSPNAISRSGSATRARGPMAPSATAVRARTLGCSSVRRDRRSAGTAGPAAEPSGASARAASTRVNASQVLRARAKRSA